jgi:SSS family solute:Na+ symporter
MFFPFIFLSGAVMWDVGGMSGLAAKLPADAGTYWTSDTPFGWFPLMVFGMFFSGVSYWSSEAQVIQRPLSSRSEADATVSYLGATFWTSLIVPILITLPALAAIHYFPGLPNNDWAMPLLIKRFLPPGLYGVMIVGLAAGVFSSADSQINAFCAMFTSDIYKRLLRPNRSEAHYLLVSKIAGVIFTVAAIGTAILFTRAEHGMMLFAVGILATIMPPFGALTIVGALIGRVNRAGALAGLIVGGITSLTLAVLAGMGHLESIAEQNLFFRAMIGFLATAGVAGVVSLLTAPDTHPAGTPKIDLTTTISPRVRRMTIVLLVGLAGMVLLWSHYFK